METKKIYYSISEVSKMLDIHEHTIRLWDSKLSGLSKESRKGKSRFFNQQHIKKISNINNLLKNNNSLNLAFKIISKSKTIELPIKDAEYNNIINSKTKDLQSIKINSIIGKLKMLIK